MKFKKLLPTKDKIENTKIFKMLIKDSDLYHFLWEFKDEGIKKGAFIGVFCAFIILPIQSILSIILCKIFKGNILVAFPATFISNPLTYIPLYYFCYRIGLLIQNSNDNIMYIQDLNFEITNIYNIIMPTIIGGIICGLFFGFLTYITTGYILKKMKKVN